MTSLSYLQRLVIILTLVGCTHVCYAQSPGNISSNLKLWLKANAGLTGSAPVTAWGDQSGNSFNAASSAGPTKLDNQINYNPSLQFNGSSNEMHITGGILGNGTSYNDLNVYVVSKAAAVKAQVLFHENCSPNRVLMHAPWSDGDIYWDAGNSSGNYRLSVAWGGSTSNYYVWSLNYSTTTSTPDSHKQDISRNGLNLANDATATAPTGDGSNFDIGFSGAGNYHEGEIAEIVIYGGQLTSAQQDKIETYLAVKYGITLSNTGGGTIGDYTSSAGTLIWDASATSTYHFDVCGIGRDDNSALGQVKSKSQNTDGVLTIYADGEGTNTANSFVDIADNEWFLAGNNNGAATWTATGAPSGFQILSRQWHVEETGDVGNCSFWFDVANGTFDVPALNVGSSYFLIHDSDNDGSLSDETPIALYDNGTNGDATSSDNVWSISGINMAGGEEFTLCTGGAPGGVSSNLKLWLKTNAGTSTTTDASTVTTWNDQSGNSADVTAANTPSYQSNTINYNPSILYESTDRHNVNTPNINPQNSTVYVVGKPGAGDLCEVWSIGLGTGNATDIVPYVQGGYKLTYFDDGSPGTYYASSLSWAQNEVSLARAEMTNAANYDAKYSKLGGTVETLSSVNGGPTNAPNNYYHTLGNWPDNSYPEPFGYIAETIIYNSASQSSTEKNKIETYLAVKYGLTLDNAAGGTAGDYTSSAGTLLWDASAVSTYHYDLTGIGRDDNSALGQVKSKSENSDGIVTIYADGEGTNAANSFVDIANDEWFLCGNNNGAATFTSTGAPGSYKILSRQWHVEETGDVGNCSFWFDVANSNFNIPFTANNKYYLIYDTDNDNSLSDETPLLLYNNGTNGDAVANDNIYSLNGINMASGMEFTVAIVDGSTYAPGGVTTNLNLWYKADAGVTLSSGNVSNWADCSPATNDATQATVGKRPTVSSSAFNFNDALLFDGSNDYLGATGGVVPSANTKMAVYCVNKRTTGGDNWATLVNGNVGVGWQAGGWQICDVTGSDTDFGFFVYDYASYPAHNTSPDLTTLNIISGVYDGSTIYYYSNSVQKGSVAYTSTVGSESNVTQIGGNSTGAYTFNGNIAEVGVYSTNSSSAERNKIETYLALKYGITLDNTGGGTIGDYTSSNGTLLWDASVNATYHNDVTGIGRDDNTALDQRISKSDNSDNIVTISLENDFTTNNASRTTAFSADQTFMLWGNDDAGITFATTFNTSLNSRMTRIWKRELTNTAQNVYIKFTTAAISNSTTYYLIGETSAAGTTWYNLSTATSAGSGNTVTFGPVKLSSKTFFTIANTPSPLPIDLLSFNGIQEKESARLEWFVATEINNDYFTLERSFDNFNWTELTKVKGAGNSTVQTSYKYYDNNPKLGVNYYRLSQTDFNGKSKTFNTVAVNFKEYYNFTVFYEKNSQSIILNSSEPITGNITLYNMLGQTLNTQSITDRNHTEIPTQNLTKGIYYLRFTDSENVGKTFKVFVD